MSEGNFLVISCGSQRVNHFDKDLFIFGGWIFFRIWKTNSSQIGITKMFLKASKKQTKPVEMCT